MLCTGELNEIRYRNRVAVGGEACNLAELPISGWFVVCGFSTMPVHQCSAIIN
jgi:hypothetical protein